MKLTLTVPGKGESSIAEGRLDSSLGIPGFGAFLRTLHDSHSPKGESCPYCGWTQQKCQETGYVGCALCYSSLEMLMRGPTSQT